MHGRIVRGAVAIAAPASRQVPQWIRRSQATAPNRDPYGMLILISALALNGQQAEAGEALKLYLSDPGERKRSRTVSEFKVQQLAMGSSPNWIA